MYKVYIDSDKNACFQTLPSLASVKAFVHGLVAPYIAIEHGDCRIIKFRGVKTFQTGYACKDWSGSKNLLKSFKKSSCKLPPASVQSSRVVSRPSNKVN